MAAKKTNFIPVDCLHQMADRGSYSSLPDSGISDQETRDRRPDDALAHLPGPGKMKQMTNQRGENDMDSGFIGSIVSTEGAQNPPRGWEPEAPLRLRDRQSGDRCVFVSHLVSNFNSLKTLTHLGHAGFKLQALYICTMQLPFLLHSSGAV